MYFNFHYNTDNKYKDCVAGCAEHKEPIKLQPYALTTVTEVYTVYTRANFVKTSEFFGLSSSNIIHCYIKSFSPWLCTLPPGHPPEHGTIQSRTLCRPGYC